MDRERPSQGPWPTDRRCRARRLRLPRGARGRSAAGVALGRRAWKIAAGLAALAALTAFAPTFGAQREVARATFAGGCFWCMEPPFDELDGVLSTTSGYAGGEEPNPDYKQVSAGRTSHAEVVQVEYDPSKVTYEELLEVFWRNIDPTVKDRQFCDWGRQYRTAILYDGDEQRRAAEASLAALEASGRFERIWTELVPLGAFYPAEDYHQDFYKKNPGHYYRYRNGCGRDRRLQELWGAGP